jgi:hypothetical protein
MNDRQVPGSQSSARNDRNQGETCQFVHGLVKGSYSKIAVRSLPVGNRPEPVGRLLKSRSE